MAYPPIIPINIDVRGAIRSMEDLTKQLNEKELNKATARAINRTLAHLVTRISSEIPKVYALKKFQLKDRFIIKPASMFSTKKGGGSTANFLTGKIESVSNRISAANFEHRLTSSGETTRIKYMKKGGKRVLKGKGRGKDSLFIKIYKGKSGKKVQQVFMMQKGGSPFFAFRGKYNKIDEYREAKFQGRDVQGLLTQSVWDMAVNDQVQLPTSVDGSDFFAKRFEHEVNNLIRIKTQVP